MLVLSRKKNEAVVVGSPGGLQRLLKLTVLDIKGRSVRLGFDAKADVPIQRCEICDRALDGNLAGNAKPSA